MFKSLPPTELLRKLLRYEPDTGNLYWRVRTPDMFLPTGRGSDWTCRSWNTRYSTNLAFTTVSKTGYLCGHISNTQYRAHRIIWAIFHGEPPTEEIDHINGDRQDNRIVNLRAVSKYENMKNTKMPASNTSGTVGVSWHDCRGKWTAKIQVKGRSIYLGNFTVKADAIDARAAADIKYSFHENHGRVNVTPD